MNRLGIDFARDATIQQRDELVESGEAFGGDDEIRKYLTMVSWETYCAWREDYRKRKCQRTGSM